MLSESATVAPLSPVPVGVCSSFDCELERGILRKDRFFLGSPSGCVDAVPSADSVDLEGVCCGSSADAGPREEDRGGGTMVFGAGVAFVAAESISIKSHPCVANSAVDTRYKMRSCQIRTGPVCLLLRVVAGGRLLGGWPSGVGSLGGLAHSRAMGGFTDAQQMDAA